jgi:acetyl esterase/lipase
MANWIPPENSLPIYDGTPPGYQRDYGQPVPVITPYPLSNGKRSPAVVVFPGGGYVMKAEHEAEPIARWLNEAGVAAFVLDYRVSPYHHPIPLLDARRAVQWVRAHASEYHVDPQKIGVLGFSAGGHLASTVGTHFEALDGEIKDEVGRYSYRPDALILCYPVITFGEYGHRGSDESLLGPNIPPHLRAYLSNELQVSDNTPPTFLWHTANDGGVPVENSLLFAQALSAHHVPFDLHVFADGPHGIGLAKDYASAEPWTDLCARWLKNLWEIKD